MSETIKRNTIRRHIDRTEGLSLRAGLGLATYPLRLWPYSNIEFP